MYLLKDEESQSGVFQWDLLTKSLEEYNKILNKNHDPEDECQQEREDLKQQLISLQTENAKLLKRLEQHEKILALKHLEVTVREIASEGADIVQG